MESGDELDSVPTTPEHSAETELTSSFFEAQGAQAIANAHTQFTPPRPAGRPDPTLHETEQEAKEARITPFAPTHGIRGLERKDYKTRYARHARVAQRTTIGTIPLDKFLGDEDLCPKVSAIPMPDFGDDCFRRLKIKNEKDMQEAIPKALNKIRCAPGYGFYDTSTSGGGLGSSKPDSFMYHDQDVREFLPKSVGQLKAEAKEGLAELFLEFKPNVNDDPFLDPTPEDENTVGVKQTNLFADLRHSVYGEKRKQTLGQVTAYAAYMMQRQYRSFVYGILFCGTKLRIMRWDRDGCIVTRSVDYKNEPGILLEFLWRLSHATLVERGYDMSHTDASPAEKVELHRLIRQNVLLQNFNTDEEGLKELGIPEDVIDTEMSRHYKEDRVAKFAVYDDITEEVRHCLVSIPIKTPHDVAGRCTRGYWGAIWRNSEWVLAFVKDTWRIVNSKGKGPKEGSTYRKIGAVDEGYETGCDDEDEDDVDGEGDSEPVEGAPDEKEAEKVPEKETKEASKRRYPVNIPRLYAHGDVRTTEDGLTIPNLGDNQVNTFDKFQTTVTHLYINADWASMLDRTKSKFSVNAHIHYRVVVSVVGRPLDTFSNAKELFGANLDVVRALKYAHKRDHLHRDVSDGNIVLFRSRVGGRRRGFLIDWEYGCKVLPDRRHESNDRCRTGTPAFMSGYSLQQAGKNFRHTLQDDMESVVLILLYYSVRWLPHKREPDLTEKIDNFFLKNMHDGLTRATIGTDLDQIRRLLDDFGFDEETEEHKVIRDWFIEVYLEIGDFYSRRRDFKRAHPDALLDIQLWELEDLERRLVLFVRRENIEAIGWTDVHEKLLNVDPESAEEGETWTKSTSHMAGSVAGASGQVSSYSLGGTGSKRTRSDEGYSEGEPSEGGPMKIRKLLHRSGSGSLPPESVLGDTDSDKEGHGSAEDLPSSPTPASKLKGQGALEIGGGKAVSKIKPQKKE